jgi:hypothetical protein
MWEEEYNVIDITSAFVGITTPLPDIVSKIAQLGWEFDGVNFKGDSFVASAKSRTGDKLEATGNTEGTAAGNLFKDIQRLNTMSMPFNARVAAWDDPFVDLTEAIAHEYADAKSYDKKAASAWTELAEDCRRRVDVIRTEIDIEITDNPIPYKSYSEMAEDIIQKQHFVVSRANASHPIWSISQVIDFRIAHDILGHAASGGDWSWFGINRAFQAHAPLLTYTAQKALFTEVIGQGAFNNYYGSMAPQKIAFLKIFDNPEEGKDPYHHPVHPSQTIIPGAVPSITHEMNKIGSFDNLGDPNEGWQSNILPLDRNAYNWHRVRNADGEMVDPLNSRALFDVAHGIHSDWHNYDEGIQEQAVANAFRNVFLKPGKHERAHAQHYQAVNHLPGSASDPSLYWNALTKARDEHNNARGYVQANQETDPFHHQLKRHIQNINPDLKHGEIHNLMNDTLLNMRVEEEKEAKDKLGPEASAQDIHREATKRLIKRLKKMTNTNLNQDHDFENENMFFESKHPDSAIYPQPLAHHIEPICEIANSIKDVTRIALEDIGQGGKGHHFRSSLMQQLSEDISPEQIDEAWFYLAPMTSQLGVVNSDILKALGHKKEDLGVRDYFKAERQLQGARDASGYEHLPLAQFSKGLKNLMRQSPGYHPTKLHLHVISPSDHNHIDWSTRENKSEKPSIPAWFNDTKDVRKQIGKAWDRMEALEHPKDAIPFRKKADAAFSTILKPFYTDPNSKEKIYGRDGQSTMQHMIESMALNGQNLSTPEIWALNPDAGKEVVNGS